MVSQRKLLILLKIDSTDTRAQVLTPEGLTELFNIIAGVLQGDTLAPYLFILVVDYCMKLTLENHPDIRFSLKYKNYFTFWVTNNVFAD